MPNLPFVQCAPVKQVQDMSEAGLDVAIFFYNPNIHPREEYEIRKDENKRYADKLGIPFIDADYDDEAWYERARGLEWSPERGERCTVCFDMRMERTGKMRGRCVLFVYQCDVELHVVELD